MRCCTSGSPPSLSVQNHIKEQHLNDSPEPIKLPEANTVPTLESIEYSKRPIGSSYSMLNQHKYNPRGDIPEEMELSFLFHSRNSPGRLTSKELLMKALYLSGRHPSKKKINKYWATFAKHGYIDLEAFAELCREERFPVVDDFLSVFERLDKEKTGYVDMRDLESLLTTRGEKLSGDEFRKLASLLNVSPNGILKYDDLCQNIAVTSHDCIELIKHNQTNRSDNSDYRPVSSTKSRVSNAASFRSHNHEFSEQQMSLRRQLLHRYPDSVFCTVLDPSRGVKKKTHSVNTWVSCSSSGYFIVDDPSKGGYVSSTYYLTIKEETEVYATAKIRRSQRFNERLVNLDIGLYIVNEAGKNMPGNILLAEFGFGEVNGTCVLRPGRYLVVPYTTGCILQDLDANKKEKSAKSMKLTLANGKLSKELMECIEDIFRLFDLDGDGFLSKNEFEHYYRNCEDETLDSTAWEFVLEKSEAEGEKLSFPNFIKLFEVELEQGGDESGIEDIFTGLSNLGISNQLIMEEACGFKLEILCENQAAACRLQIGDEISSKRGPIRDALVSEAIAEGEEVPCRQLSEVGASLFVLEDENHAVLTVRYKAETKSRLQLRIDASESAACLFSSPAGSLRRKEGNSAGGQRNIVTAMVNSNTTVPLILAVPSHPERMAEFVITSVDLL